MLTGTCVRNNLRTLIRELNAAGKMVSSKNVFIIFLEILLSFL